MKQNKDTAGKIAEFLLQIKAIKLNVASPFTWSSGLKSPIYCDNRKTLTYPKIRTYIRQEFVNLINEEFGKPDVIAGVATGAIAHGMLVAQDMGLPFVYVRTTEKGHGLSNLIEGVVESGQSVVVIEDLISTGGSSLKAVEALTQAGCKVKGMVAIFTYQLPQALENFKKAKVPLYTLCNYTTLIEEAVSKEYITQHDVESLVRWRQAPDKWGESL
jgi:orotate phosphoribosyltransferase